MSKKKTLKEPGSPSLAFEPEETGADELALQEAEEKARQAEEAEQAEYDRRKAELKARLTFKVSFDPKQGGHGTHIISGELEGKLTIAKVPGGIKAPELVKTKTAELSEQLIRSVLAKEFSKKYLLTRKAKHEL